MKQIGRYQIRQETGRGGMSTVYEAFDPHFKRAVAVKVMTRELLEDPTLKARFEREAQTIAGLEHPAIVPVYDFGEDEKRPFLVMRLMTGGTLADRLKNGPLSVSETARILKRIGSALDRAHDQGVIHRDLKPSNIMFDQYGDAFLADFGIARLTEGAVTLTGENVIGTPAYMSPEQIHGDRTIDGRSDIYALGVICFEMLTGKRPYQEKTPAKLMMQHLIDPVPNIREANPDLPPGVEEVISRSMAKSPDERYKEARELTDTLGSLISIDPQTVTAAKMAAAAAAPSRLEERAPITDEETGDMEVTVPDSGEMAALAADHEPAAVSDAVSDAGVREMNGRPQWLIPAAVIVGIIIIAIIAAFLFGDSLISGGGERAENGEPLVQVEESTGNADQQGQEENQPAQSATGDDAEAPDPYPTAEAHMERFYAAMEAEDFETAERSIDQAIELLPDEAWLYTERAWLRETTGNLEGAMREIEQAIELDPQNGDYYAVRGNIHRQLDEYADALANHQRAVELNPENPYLHMELAETFKQLDEPVQALEQYNQALSMKDDEAWYFDARAEVYFMLGEFELGLADLERASELEPEDRGFFTKAGDIFLNDINDPQRALDYYNRAVERSPDDGWVYADRAAAFQAMGDTRAALADLDHAIELSPDNANFFIRRGLLYWYELEDPDAAFADLNRAVEVEPDNADAFAERANFFQNQAGDLVAALEDRNWAVELDPEGPWRYADRFHVYRALDRIDEALADLQTCLELDPDYYWCAWERAWMFDELGSVADAVADFQHFLDLAPDDDCPECHDEARNYIEEHIGEI